MRCCHRLLQKNKHSRPAIHGLICASMLLLLGTCHAALFTPQDDNVIVEKLVDTPIGNERSEIRSLQQQIIQQPNNHQLASHLAQRYIELSRRYGDPRYLGYAQAAVKPWWSQDMPPADVLLIRATIQQSQHAFEASLQDLDKLTRSQPDNPQLWLTRATIHQVQGQYPLARQECARLLLLAPGLIAQACMAETNSLSGQTTFTQLEQAYRSTQEADSKGWVASILADMAERLGNEDAANRYHQEAVALNQDAFSKAAYADWLLARQQAEPVMQLLKQEVRNDGLLLRLALAQNQLKLPQAKQSILLLQARIDDAHLRGDITHQREAARFYLELKHDQQTALQLAQSNWQQQKEPADVCILLQTASAAKDQPTIAQVHVFLQQTGLKDQRLEQYCQGSS